MVEKHLGSHGRNRKKEPQNNSEIMVIEGKVVDSELLEKIPHATHVGDLKIGDAEIQCAVLSDGTRVLTQTSFLKAIGRNPRPSAKGQFPDSRPSFLTAANLEPYISANLLASLQPILFKTKGAGGYKGVAIGYRAETLPQVCYVFLDAAANGQLHSGQQERIAEQCRLLVRGFATVGIVALVDEATGYQEERDRDALQRILEAYIAQELLPWAKRFPDEFYKQMFRLHGWQYSPLSVKRPQIVGHWTNDIVYRRLPLGVLDELRKNNPVVNRGRRAHKHHQFLTDDIGNPHLEKHLAVVTALMRIAPNWRKFISMLNRAVPIPNQAQQMELFKDEEFDDLELDE